MHHARLGYQTVLLLCSSSHASMNRISKSCAMVSIPKSEQEVVTSKRHVHKAHRKDSSNFNLSVPRHLQTKDAHKVKDVNRKVRHHVESSCGDV